MGLLHNVHTTKPLTTFCQRLFVYLEPWWEDESFKKIRFRYAQVVLFN